MQAGTFTRPHDDEGARLMSAGRATPGTQLRVVNDGAPVAAGEEGELQARGCSVFDGYLENAQPPPPTPSPPTAGSAPAISRAPTPAATSSSPAG